MQHADDDTNFLPNFPLHALACAAALALSPLALLAQTAATPAGPAASAPAAASAEATTLPVVRITATADRETAASPVPGYVARRSATATKTDTPLNEVPQSITVITADQVTDQASQTLQDTLRYTAGVRHETYGMDNRGDWFTMRGGSESSVLLDGLRVPIGGGWGNVRSEPYGFERIEVLRGPASIVAGQNGPGGVVNLVSKRPQPEPLREIALQLGSYGHKQLAVDLTGPLDTEGQWLYRIVALGRDTGTQVDHADEQRTYVRPSLTWQPSPATTATVYAEYQEDESGNTNAFFPIEGTLDPAPHGKIPMSTFIGEPAWDWYGGTRKRLGWEIEHKLGDAWTLRHHLRHDRVEGGILSMYAAWWEGFVDASGTPDPNGTYLNRQWYGHDESLRVTNADLLFEGRLRAGRVQHTLLLGVDAMRSRDSNTSTDGAATPLDVYHPVYGSFARPDTSGATPTITDVRNWGLLVQDQMKIDDRWIVVAGLRRDSARSTQQKDEATSRNLGLVWLADGGWSPYVGYAESFEPVVGYGTAFDGSPFVPKRGKQLEAGVKWQSPDQRLTASAAAYRAKERNRPATDPDPTHVDFYVQRGEVTVKGVEVEAAARLRAWDLTAQLTYTDAQITSTSTEDARYLGHQLEKEPKHTASLWAVHRFADWGFPGLRAGLGVRHAGATGNGIGTVTVPSVTVFDALLGYDAGPWRLALNINNLADKAYVATCLERGDCWFGTRRKAVATVAYRW